MITIAMILQIGITPIDKDGWYISKISKGFPAVILRMP